ncbi:hypothetical protein [Candidatus Odyssella thessalonicensis]|nr:hypothetical protein [Candidatus Odyssella thessalonicensis]
MAYILIALLALRFVGRNQHIFNHKAFEGLTQRGKITMGGSLALS